MNNSTFISTKHSVIRTAVFTFGHFAIDIVVNWTITGAAIELVAISAMLSPILNAVWYFVLDRYLFCGLLKKYFVKT